MSDPLATRRKLPAKRFNESMKLLATSLNAVALTTLGAGLILPTVAGAAVDSAWIWILAAVGLHLLAHSVFRLLRSED